MLGQGPRSWLELFVLFGGEMRAEEASFSQGVYFCWPVNRKWEHDHSRWFENLLRAFIYHGDQLSQ